MEDKLGPAARLVDFLLGCTLDCGLKMQFEIQSMSVHMSLGCMEGDCSPRRVTALEAGRSCMPFVDMQRR